MMIEVVELFILSVYDEVQEGCQNYIFVLLESSEELGKMNTQNTLQEY